MISGAGLLPAELSADSDFHVSLVSMQLTTQFFIHMSASCWLAFILGFPIIIYLLWSFVEPALYESEKHGIRRAFLFGNLMFFLGVLVGYFLVLPLAVRFLSQYTLSDQITGMISLDSYMDNFFTLILLMGMVFELPLLACFSAKWDCYSAHSSDVTANTPSWLYSSSRRSSPRRAIRLRSLPSLFGLCPLGVQRKHCAPLEQQ